MFSTYTITPRSAESEAKLESLLKTMPDLDVERRNLSEENLTLPGPPVSPREMSQYIDEIIADMEGGNRITLDELKEEMKEWQKAKTI